MLKAKIQTEQIVVSGIYEFKDVVSMSIYNYSDEVAEISVNGVVRKLSEIVDIDLQFPAPPFTIDASGHAFDIKIEIKKLKLIVIDYAILTKC